MTIHKSGAAWKPFVRAAAVEVDTKFPRNADTGTYGGHGENSPVGAYAVDFMINAKSQGDAIAEYVWANRIRLGVWYVIWNRRIISRTKGRGTWRKYTNPVASRRGTASGDHTNHVHVSFYTNGKYTPPKGGSPEPVGFKGDAKSTVYLDRLKPGVDDSQSVFVVQTALVKVLGSDAGITATGDFGDSTLAAAKQFQTLVKDDVVDGLLGPYDVAELLKRAKMSNTVEAKA